MCCETINYWKFWKQKANSVQYLNLENLRLRREKILRKLLPPPHQKKKNSSYIFFLLLQNLRIKCSMIVSVVMKK